jgi:hypothetical protein
MRSTGMSRAMGMAALVLAGVTACKGDNAEKDDAAVKTTTAAGKDTSASSTAAENRKVSMVRMINALPTMSDVVVTADDNALFNDVDYKGVTDYVELKDNVTRFRLKNEKSDTTIASNNEMMTDGSRYTVVALPEKDGGVRLRVLHDEIVPDVGKTRLRVVHAVRGVGEVDVMSEGNKDAIFDNINFGSEAGYKEMDPMQGTLIVLVEGTNRQLLKKAMNLVAGHSYTIVLAGNGTQRVDAILVDDQAVAK